MFDTLNAQQQPFIQSGYGAMSKLNTLMGIGGGPGGYGGSTPATPGTNNGFAPTPEGGVNQRVPQPISNNPTANNFGAPADAPNLPLRHILMMRAQQGDPDAQRIVRGMV